MTSLEQKIKLILKFDYSFYTYDELIEYYNDDIEQFNKIYNDVLEYQKCWENMLDESVETILKHSDKYTKNELYDLFDSNFEEFDDLFNEIQYQLVKKRIEEAEELEKLENKNSNDVFLSDDEIETQEKNEISKPILNVDKYQLKYNQKNTPKKRRQLIKKEIEARSENQLKKIKQYQHNLENTCKKILKKYDGDYRTGEITFKFLILINGLVAAHLKNKNKKYFILPTHKFLAQILGCSEDWVNRLVIRFQNILNLKRLDKTQIKADELKYAKYKNFVWTISILINYVFSELKESVYFFKTKFWKENARYIDFAPPNDVLDGWSMNFD